MPTFAAIDRTMTSGHLLGYVRKRVGVSDRRAHWVIEVSAFLGREVAGEVCLAYDGSGSNLGKCTRALTTKPWRASTASRVGRASRSGSRRHSSGQIGSLA